MEEKAKLILYAQLEEMHELNEKQDAKDLISKEEFLKLTDKEVLEYTFNYRDEETDFGDNVYYIEMPDMNLEGQDLKGVHISKFMLSRTEEGEKVASNINLKDTGAKINLTNIGISEQTTDDLGIATQIVDFSSVNFHGCNIYGILNDEYLEESGSRIKNKFVVKGKENLDEQYIQRRQEHHLTPEAKKLSDRAYERLINGDSLKGMKGNKEYIDLTDYDFSEIKDYETLAKEMLNYEMLISNTGLEKMYGDDELAILESEYTKGNMEFVDRYFDKINRATATEIVKKEYTKGNMEFVDRYFDKIDKGDRSEIVKKEHTKGNMKFVDRYFYAIDIATKTEIVKEECTKGNIEFVDRYFDKIDEGDRSEIVKKEYAKGNMEFVDRHFNKIDEATEKEILESEYKKGNIDFVKFYFNRMNKVTKTEILESQYAKGNIEFVDEHFCKMYIGDKSKIVKEQCSKGNIGFVERYFYEIDEEDRSEIVKEEYTKGNMEFVDEHFYGRYNAIKRKILASEYAKGNMEFVDRHFWHLYGEDKSEIIKKEYTKGNMEFVDRHIYQIDKVIKTEIVKEEYTKGNMEFVDRNIYGIDKVTKKEIAKQELKKGNDELIHEFLEEENNLKVLQGSNIVVCSGRMLNDELSKKEIDKDIVLGLIKAGSGLEYTSYTNVDKRTPERIPTLYKALKIEDDVTRKEIVSAMLKAGVRTDTYYIKQIYNDDTVETTKEKCLDVNNGELVTIMKELGMELPKGAKFKEEKKSNKDLVESFLTHEVGLDKEQREKLEEEYNKLGKSIYSCSVERLSMQKEILDNCGGTKHAFTTGIKVLMQDPQVLYARLRLYNENEITIAPEKLNTTLGISKKGFAKNFGSIVLDKENMEDVEYEYKLKQALVKKYPMPANREELRRDLETMNRNIGGENAVI